MSESLLLRSADVEALAKLLADAVAKGAESLAASINDNIDQARELLSLHRQTYPRFWRWSESAVDHAMLYRYLQTVFGWRLNNIPRRNALVVGLVLWHLAGLRGERVGLVLCVSRCEPFGIGRKAVDRGLRDLQ